MPTDCLILSTGISRTTRSRAKLAVRVALVVALLTVVFQFPNQLALLRLYLPVIRLWSDPDAQIRLQLTMSRTTYYERPTRSCHAMLLCCWLPPAVMSAIASTLIFHRTLYFLAPRPVWWLTPAPLDGTWESRWWILAPLTPESVHAIAAEKGASYILAYDLPQPLAVGQQVTDLGGGSLLQLDEGVPSWSEQTSASDTHRYPVANSASRSFGDHSAVGLRDIGAHCTDRLSAATH